MDSAEITLKKAQTLCNNYTDKPLESRIHLALGSVELYRGKGQAALEHLNIALTQMSALGYSLGLARTLENIGLAHDLIGNADQAISFWEQAIDLRKTNNIAYMGNSFFNFGIILNKNGQYERAISTLEQAIAAFRKSGDLQGIALALTEMDWSLGLLGRDVHESPLLLEAMDICESIEDTLLYATIVNAMGFTQMRRGDLLKAHSSFTLASERIADIDSPIMHARVSTNLSLINGMIGNLDAALEHAVEGQKFLTITDSEEFKGYVFKALGKAHLLRDELPQAETAFQVASGAFRNSMKQPLWLEPHAQLAHLALAVGNQKEATRLIAEVMAAVGDSLLFDLDLPLHFFDVCYRVLAEIKDARSAELLTLAKQHIERFSAEIRNPHHRNQYLNEIPLNKRLHDLTATL